MGNRNKDRLAKLNLALKPDEVESAEPARTRSGVNSLLQRESALTKLATGERRTVQHMKHPTARIRLWSGNDRDYRLLSVERCADLIDGFTRTGQQEFPAIVRKVNDDPEHDYEVICGARRHWTAEHLGWPLLIEVRELSDRQAFILQDLENRDREDVSDYERSIDYKQALPRYFEGNRAQMAQFLEIDKGNFHRLLELAELPKAIVEAYADLRELRVHHGTAYRKLLADPATKRRLMDRARGVKGERLSGPKVFAVLKGVAKTSKGKSAPGEERRYGEVRVRRDAKNQALQISVPLPSQEEGHTAGQLGALRKALDAIVTDLGAGKL